MVEETPPAKRRSLLLPIPLVALASIVIGIGAGYALSQASVGDVNQKLTAAEIEKAVASARAAALEAEAVAKDTDLANLRETSDRVTEVEAKLDSLNKQLGTMKGSAEKLSTLKSLSSRLANDRLLLTEMRKEPPPTRAEATIFWRDIKVLAIKSDPALGVSADRIRSTLPRYFGWAEAQYSSTQEEIVTYQLLGAASYDVTIKDFWNSVLLVVINRIDEISQQTS